MVTLEPESMNKMGIKTKPRQRPGANRVSESLDLHRHLPYRLVVVANTLSLGASRIFSRIFGLGNREWRVMAVLGPHGPMTAADIVQRIALDKTTVSRAVARLAKRGLVLQERDRSDSRRILVSLTGQGIDLHDRIVPVARRRAEAIESALTRDELAALDSILHKLQDRVDWLLDEGDTVAKVKGPHRDLSA